MSSLAYVFKMHRFVLSNKSMFGITKNDDHLCDMQFSDVAQKKTLTKKFWRHSASVGSKHSGTKCPAKDAMGAFT